MYERLCTIILVTSSSRFKYYIAQALQNIMNFIHLHTYEVCECVYESN